MIGLTFRARNKEFTLVLSFTHNGGDKRVKYGKDHANKRGICNRLKP